MEEAAAAAALDHLRPRVAGEAVLARQMLKAHLARRPEAAGLDLGMVAELGLLQQEFCLSL